MINLTGKENIYFTSDTHFGQQRTLELSRRPFTCIEEMDRTMMANWNSIVGKDDIVIHLGDFGNYDMVKQLNGNIYLILGNYERKDIKEGKITLGKLHELGFKAISKPEVNRLYAKFTDSECNKDLYVAMMHEPEHYDKSYFNLFGHIHGRQMCKRFGLDVGVDCHHFRPISIHDVLFYKEAIEKYYDHNVFMSGNEYEEPEKRPISFFEP